MQRKSQGNEGDSAAQDTVKAPSPENNIDCRPCDSEPEASHARDDDSRSSLEGPSLLEHCRQHSLSKPPLPPGSRSTFTSLPLPPVQSLPNPQNGMADIPPLGAPSRSLGISTRCSSIAEDRVQHSAFATVASSEEPNSPTGAGHPIALQGAMSVPEQMLHGHPGTLMSRSQSLYGNGAPPGSRGLRRTSSEKGRALELAPEPSVGVFPICVVPCLGTLHYCEFKLNSLKWSDVRSEDGAC